MKGHGESGASDHDIVDAFFWFAEVSAVYQLLGKEG
jgi:hypothetical protein